MNNKIPDFVEEVGDLVSQISQFIKDSHREKLEKIKGKILPFPFPCEFRFNAYLFILALASLTAAKKNSPVRGILNPKIIAVV